MHDTLEVVMIKFKVKLLNGLTLRLIAIVKNLYADSMSELNHLYFHIFLCVSCYTSYRGYVHSWKFPFRLLLFEWEVTFWIYGVLMLTMYMCSCIP